MSLLTEVITLIPRMAFNKGEVRRLMSVLLESVLKNTERLRDDLPADDNHEELEERIEKVAKVVQLLRDDASTFSVLKAAAGMADGQDPTLVVATRENLPTKKAYFFNLDANVCQFIVSLEALGVVLSDNSRQVVSDKTTAASAQIVMHEVLFRTEDEPGAVHDISDVDVLINRLQKNPSDRAALNALRALFESEHHFATFQADGEPIELERARELLTHEHDDCLHQATIFRMCSETEFTSIPLVIKGAEVDQPVLSLTAITNRHSFLAYCPEHIRFLLTSDPKIVAELDFLDTDTELRGIFDAAQRQHQNILHRANEGDARAADILREFLNRSEAPYFTCFEIDGTICSPAAAQQWLDRNNARDFLDALLPRIRLTRTNDRDIILSFLNPAAQFAVTANVDHVIEKTEIAHEGELRRLRDLQTQLIHDLEENLALLRSTFLKCEEERSKTYEQARTDSGLLFELQNWNLPFLFKCYPSEEELGAFCDSINLPPEERQALLDDFEAFNKPDNGGRRWHYAATLFTRGSWYKTKVTTVVKHFKKRKEASADAAADAQLDKERVQTAIRETKRLKAKCTGPLEQLKEALNSYGKKDIPTWWQKKTYRAFIEKRDEILRLIGKIEAGNETKACLIEKTTELEIKAGGSSCWFYFFSKGHFKDKTTAVREILDRDLPPSKPSASAAA